MMISSRLERGLEHALEELVGVNAPLVGDDGGAEPQHAGRIIGVGVVVGDRAADGAAMAHGGIPDLAGEVGQRRNILLHHRRGRDLDVRASSRR